MQQIETWSKQISQNSTQLLTQITGLLTNVFNGQEELKKALSTVDSRQNKSRDNF